jgi:hypothetical protein
LKSQFNREYGEAGEKEVDRKGGKDGKDGA